MDGNVLEKLYQERLEERVVAEIAKEKGCALEEAMDIYYKSDLCDKIHKGEFGIQYLDYKVLVQILLEKNTVSC